MRFPSRSTLGPLVILAALAISCTDSPTGPVPVAPDGTITLSDTLYTRGAVVRASVDVPTGFALVPGSVTWSVVSGSASIAPIGGTDDSVDVTFTGSGAAQLRANYAVRSLGVGSSLTIATPARRPAADVAVTASRAITVAEARLDYTTLPAASATAGATLGNVQVAITDARGRVITTATDSIVVAIDPTSGTAGATLLGTLRVRPTAGVATFAALSIRRAGVGYRLIASSPSLPARDTATTTIVAGAPNAAQSTLTVADTLRTVGQTTTVTIVVRDEYGNPVLTATPAAFTPNASAGTLGAFTCTNGTCTATYTAPDVPGAPTIGATIGGTQITGGPQTITISAGPAAKLVITGDTLKVAGTTTQLTLTALDARGNVATSYRGNKTLTFSGPSLAPIGTAPTVATKSVGETAEVTFAAGVAASVAKRLVKVETAVIAATDGTISAANADRLAVRVTAAAVSATQSTIVVADSVRSVGQSTTVTVTLKDAFGNPNTGATAASFAVTPSAGTLGEFTCVSGVCTATYTPPSSEATYTIAGAIGGSTIGSGPLPVRVADLTPPVITGPSGAAGAAASVKSIQENTTAVHTFTANETVTWSLDGGADAAKFAINATTGALTFLAAPDFELPTDTDGDNVYVVTVKAVDAAGNISTQTVSVTVTNVDDTAPSITGPSGAAGAAASVKSIQENTTAVHTFTANEPVTWSLDGGEDQARFAINASTGALTLLAPAGPDFENPTDANTNNVYVVTVKAVDAAGNVATQTVTVTVTDLDDTAPAITGPSGAAGATASAKSVPENTTAVHTFTANESVTWSLDGGADQAKFAIDATTGALTFIDAPDFESPTDSDGNNVYVVTVKARDAIGNLSTQTVTVTVTNVEDTAITGPSGAPGAATSAKSVPENTTAVHTFTASEPVTWSLDGGADGAKFAINAASGALTFLAAPDFELPTDTDGDNVYVVTVKATDADGNVTTQTVSVTVTNVDDTAPAITGPSGAPGAATSTKSVAENTTAVHTFTANETVTWSLDGGEDGAKFAINASTGALTFLAAPDFEAPTDVGANNTYVVIVKATDGATLTSTQTLTVTVTDVPEGAPAITGPSGGSGSASSAVSIFEGTTAVHTFTSNKSGVTWSLNGGADAAKFTINASTGALTFQAAPVFATPTDANVDNQYIVVVRASDLAGASDQTVTVTVLQSGALQLTASAQTAVAVGEVTERITFTVRSGATPTAVTTNTVFSLSSTGGGTFYSNYEGTTAITSATVLADANQFVVYYKQTTGGGTTTTLTATRSSGDNVSAASVNLNVTALASASSRLSGVICTATTGNSNASSLTADGACNATAGQLVVMIFAHSPTANPYDMPTFATPTGWQKFNEDRIGTAGQPRQLRTMMFYKRVTTTGNQAVTFSTGAGGGAAKVRMTYMIVAIDNPPATGVPIDTDNLLSTMTPTAGIQVPASNAAANNSMLLAFAVQDIGSNSYVAPPGLATAAIAGQGGQAVTMILFSKDRVFSGLTPPYTVGTSQVDAASTGGVIIIGPQ